ncbi:MAG TPA: DUF805 domain-containing protein [Candidatus Saccharibacteria bacterium]|nr:DUF805 domain-containing protein [Candidatus Saccharibacteria bacterium]
MKTLRINRKSFIVAAIGGVVVANVLLVLLEIVSHMTGDRSVATQAFAWLLILFTVYLFATWIRVAFQRSWDFDFPGWAGAILALTGIFIIVLMVVPGSKGKNKYGPQPNKKIALKSMILWRKIDC